MAKYEMIIFWSEEDQAYIAEVPELAGCMADDATYQEAVKKCRAGNCRMDRNRRGIGALCA